MPAAVLLNLFSAFCLTGARRGATENGIQTLLNNYQQRESYLIISPLLFVPLHFETPPRQLVTPGNEMKC
jgi:hypothetical protein